MIKELLLNPWYGTIVIFLTQIFMLYLRTLNIVYTTNKNIFGALWSNTLFASAWLISTTIGMNSILTGQWQPMIGFVIGGAIGTYLGMKKNK